MDKIKKSLEKLSVKERLLVKTALQKLFAGQTTGLSIQKLQGQKNIYRLRKGNLRIIYQNKESEILILAIERRSEKTYRDF